jgi:sortase A
MSAASRDGRRLLVAASLLLCLAGIGMTARGFAVPVRAEVAQQGLERMFAARLTAAPERREEKATAAPATTPAASSRHASALPAKGPVARIEVKRLGVKIVVLAGGGDAERDRAPTLLKRSEGENPVTILAAHRDTHFLFVRDLIAGDEVTLQLVTGETEVYRVTRFDTVRWDAFAYPLDPARPLLALTTCYPFGGTEYGGPWRRVAWAERIG